MRYPTLPYRQTSRDGWDAVWSSAKGYADKSLRKSRAEEKAKLLRDMGVKIPDSKGLLEIGAGIGSLSSALNANPSSALLLDWSHEALRRATPAAMKVQANACAIPLRDQCVSLVIAACVLEHIERPLEAVDEIVRVMKPGATLFVVFSHRRSSAEIFRPIHRIRGKYQCGYMRATHVEDELQCYISRGLILESLSYLPANNDMPVSRFLDSLLSRPGRTWSRYAGIRLSKAILKGE